MKFQDKTSIFIEDITIKGTDCSIKLTAHLNNYTVYDYLSIPVAHRKSFATSNNSFLAPSIMFVVFIVILICCVLLICKMRKQLGQAPTDSMALDLIKSINDRSLLIADLKGDESMEIQRKSIKLHNELGKGAFGVVKRAILMKNGKETTVAVKMLKSKLNHHDEFI